jgi:hypothetical protein
LLCVISRGILKTPTIIIGPEYFDKRVQNEFNKIGAFYILLKGIFAGEEFRSGFDEMYVFRG